MIGDHVLRIVTCCLVVALAQQARGEDWPSFRGANASGVSQTTKAPATWNVGTGENVLWRTPIPGLAHSSPVISRDRVFVTSAISSKGDPYLRVGLYGASPDNPEPYVHEFKVFCLDRATGKVVWEKTSKSTVPKIQRHIKATHANCTPATDGKHVVAFFGSEGLYCYDRDGNLLWDRDLGLLDSGAPDHPEIQWGFASSPVIHEGRVVVQCDVNNQSFLAALDIRDGKEIWRVERDEAAGWSSPTVYEAGGQKRVAVNGYRHIGGYDFLTGAPVWRIAGGGDVPVPTPVVNSGLIYITNAHGGAAPIYAIRTSANGDISLQGDQSSNDHVAWSYKRRGAYMQTPLIYRGQLYNCRDNGALTVYDATSGKIVYRKRLDGGVGFTASPIAGGGNVYFTSEEGDIHVVRAGPQFDRAAVNKMDEVCMATPALADGTLFVRGQHHLTAIRNQP